jgi:hypothetical protein
MRCIARNSVAKAGNPDPAARRPTYMIERRTLVILFLMMVVSFSAFGVAEGLEQSEPAPAPAGVLAE